jgi:hypothetical protein
MRFTAACLAASLLAPFAAGPAVAQIEQNPATGVITCTTTAGRYSRRIVIGVGEGGTISGRIRLVRPDPSPRYTAAAGFIFKEAGARNAGVQIALRPGTTDTLVIGLKMPDETPLVELGEGPINVWVPISVTYADGIMTATIADRTVRRRARLVGALQPILHCNSGTFEFRLGPGLGMGETPVNIAAEP